MSLDTLDAHIAFLGIPHGSPYSMEDVNNEQSRAPTAIRQASDRAVRSLERYDFDIGGPLYMGKAIKAVDCGDVPGNMYDFQDHVKRAEQAVHHRQWGLKPTSQWLHDSPLSAAAAWAVSPRSS